MTVHTCEGCGLRLLRTDRDGHVHLADGTRWHKACLAWYLGRRMRELGLPHDDLV